jgi:hypothetical protein
LNCARLTLWVSLCGIGLPVTIFLSSPLDGL